MPIINRIPFVILPGGLVFAQYGNFGGGFTGFFTAYTSSIDVLDKDVTSVTNATSRGTLVRVKALLCGGVASALYGFIAGGLGGGAYWNEIEYLDLSLLLGNSSDKGDLTGVRFGMAGANTESKGFWAGGDVTFSPSVTVLNLIEEIDLTTTSENSSDVGDLTLARMMLAGVSSKKYLFFGGGSNGSDVYSNIIDYIDGTIGATNATDRGDMTVAKSSHGSVSGALYGFFAGGATSTLVYTNVIEYIDKVTLNNNALDRGDLANGRAYVAGVSGNTYSVFAGGLQASGFGAPGLNYMDRLNNSLLTGNSADRGDLATSRSGAGGA